MKKLLVFSAEGWCSNCKILHNVLSTVDLPIDLEIIDIDKEPSKTKQFNIRGVPTTVLVDGETELNRKVGVMSKDEVLRFVNGTD